MVLVGGEISSSGPSIDYQAVVRGVIKHIGYDDSSKGDREIFVQCSFNHSKLIFYHFVFDDFLDNAVKHHRFVGVETQYRDPYSV